MKKGAVLVRVIFCADPLNVKTVDPDYEQEYLRAQAAGFEVGLMVLEELLDGNLHAAVKRIPASSQPETAVYRGWMMRPERYAELYQALQLKNINLINTPEEYLHGHYFPYSYEALKTATPYSMWVDIAGLEQDRGQMHEQLQSFGRKPILIKDYVKSRKHEWEEACFIPNASDRGHVQKVVDTFLKRQGAELNGGVVFREFIELEPLSLHPKSGMPLSREYRLFFLHHELIAAAEYWDEALSGQEASELDGFAELARQVKSSFFTMDIAKTREGQWLVIEVGDGQVSGLPAHVDIDSFYTVLKERLEAVG
jgi:hypothetical protein